MRVMSLSELALSKYSISGKVIREGQPKTASVQFVETSPETENNVLIAYDDGLIALCDVKKQKLIRQYKVTTQVFIAYSFIPLLLLNVISSNVCTGS